MSLESLLKSIKQAQPHLELLNEVKKELDNELTNLPVEAQKLYHDNTAAIFSSIKSGDYDGAKEKALEVQKRMNKIVKKNAS